MYTNSWTKSTVNIQLQYHVPALLTVFKNKILILQEGPEGFHETLNNECICDPQIRLPLFSSVDGRVYQKFFIKHSHNLNFFHRTYEKPTCSYVLSGR
jgi:hypothetical protein